MRVNNLNNSNIVNNASNFKAKYNQKMFNSLTDTTSQIADRLIEAEKKNLDFEKKILQKLLMGFSINELSQKLGVSLYKVNEISSKYNAHKIYIQRRDAIILEKLKQGLKRETVEKEMGVSKGTVQKVADANKIFRKLVKDRDVQIIEMVKSAPDVRADRIAEVKAKLTANPNYFNDVAVISETADKFINDLM